MKNQFDTKYDLTNRMYSHIKSNNKRMYLHGAFTAIKNPLSCWIQLSKNIKIILHIVI
jgi:hypothetical protein